MMNADPMVLLRESKPMIQNLSMEQRFKEILAYHERSFQFALQCCRGDRAEAQDVLQQAYTYLVGGGLSSFRGESQLKTWWFGLIRQTAHGFFRTVARRAKRLLSFQPDPPIERDPEQLSEERQKRQKISALLNRLPDSQRLPMQLFYYEEMTLEDIAAVLGVSAKTTIQSRIKAGEKALQALLEQEGLR